MKLRGFVPGLVLFGFVACGDAPAAQPAANDHAGHGAAAESATGHSRSDRPDVGAAEPSGFSIYHAGSVWTDQNGTRRDLASLAGRVRVVAMVYTSCAYACPRILLDMKRIQAGLGVDGSDDVGFVLVSIDPDRDTPEQLASFARGSRLEPDRWTLLTGTDDGVLELAALLGVQYRKTQDGEFVHSNVITVLDRDGEAVHRQEGLGADPAATIAAIRDHAG